MSNGKYSKKRKGVATKAMLMILAVMLIIGISVGGTLAWLTDKTDDVVNTFTVGDVDIDLTETTGNTYHIVPGANITKDPTVTVKANKEPCWVFVKIVEANWPTVTEIDGTTRKINYSVDSDWTALDGVAGVYYRDAGTLTADASYPVLTNNQVTVSSTLTKAEANAITTYPTLTFTAYAIQKEGFTTAHDAWAEVSK